MPRHEIPRRFSWQRERRHQFGWHYAIGDDSEAQYEAHRVILSGDIQPWNVEPEFVQPWFVRPGHIKPGCFLAWYDESAGDESAGDESACPSALTSGQGARDRNGDQGMLRTTPYTTDSVMSAGLVHDGAMAATRQRTGCPHDRRSHAAQAQMRASTTTGVKTFDDTAPTTSPRNNAWTPRVSPHPGHHNPVAWWNRHAGKRLPAAAGSLSAT